MRRIKAGGLKPQPPTQTGDLQIGTVIAKGNRKIAQEQQQKNQYNQTPPQKPPSADNAYKKQHNNPYEDNKPPTAPQNDNWGMPMAKKRSVEGNVYNKP